MDGHTEGSLQEFGQRHHLRYEVEPEEAVTGEGRRRVGYRVRLFATELDAALAEPGSAASVDLLARLRAHAEELLRSGEAASRAEVVPASRALYESPEERGVDEVAIDLRVRCDGDEAREERCLGEIEQRLRASGVPRR